MELLQRRKFCREFLNGYNEKLHPQIISRVFEIGLLTLKRNFNKLLYSKEELDDIIKSLSGNDYVEIVPLPPRKKIEKLPNKNLEEKININNNTITKEEEEKNKMIKNQHLHRYYLQNPNFTTQNNEIYPFWWWNNKEENLIEEKNNNCINKNFEENNYNDNENYEEEEYNNDNENINAINEEECQMQIINNEVVDDNIKKYSIKKLNNNPHIQQLRPNPKQIVKNNIYKCPQNDTVNKPRVKSTRTTQRNNINNNINNQKFKKINNNNMMNKNQNRKNGNLKGIPKMKYLYNNGRIVKMKGDNNYYGDINMMNMTEPNNKF